MRRIAPPPACMAIALVLAACGGSEQGRQNAEEQVRDSIATLERAIASEDPRAICRLLSVEAMQAVPQFHGGAPENCVAVYDDMLGGSTTDADARLDDERVRISGGVAFVSATNAHTGELERAEFVRERGTWKARQWFSALSRVASPAGGRYR